MAKDDSNHVWLAHPGGISCYDGKNFRLEITTSQLQDQEVNEMLWDGMYKGVRQEMNTYTWLLEAIGADGRKYVKSGTVVLIR